jgi:hypothetical protein
MQQELIRVNNTSNNKCIMTNSTSSGGGGWQKLDFRHVQGKIRWTGDGEDWKMLMERGKALGLIKECKGEFFKHSYSPEFFQQIDDARDGLLGFIVSGDPKFHYSMDPRVGRGPECFRRRIHVPGKPRDKQEDMRLFQRELQRAMSPWKFPRH